ncbi:hypothetical protein [Streptococcus devriesei]|uniref:hypothetical protein n=1 Tax=Streptococcus devriesei TaxID=231233 RepID=UPI00040ABBC9|nr:hypothetical protein [Streptococcus devriesei]
MAFLETVFKWIIELYNDDKVAFVSLVISIVVGLYTWISKANQDKIDREFKEFQKELAVYQQKVSELQFNFEAQENFKPYFELNRTKSSTYVKKGKLIAQIYLTNVGRGTATQIMTNPIDFDVDGDPIYFRSTPKKQTHSIYSYFSENFAIPNESIYLSTTANEQSEKQSFCIEFKIKFCDSAGRTYEQKFEFSYDNFLVKGISLKSVTYEPTLIN